MEFKVGKWYKCIWCWNGGQLYFKYAENSSKSVIATDYITASYDRNGGFALSELKDIKELNSLEEIQQYLPEGHEDKIKRSIFDGLIEGNYYRYQYPDYYVIAICSSNNGDRMKCGFKKHDSIARNNEFYRTGFSLNQSKSTHPATQEEIEHLDACIAAGKYVDKPEKWIPKVGEWCVYKMHIDGDSLGRSSYKTGQVFQVSKVDPGLKCNAAPNSTWVYSKIGTTCHLALRKAFPHEIPNREDKPPFGYYETGRVPSEHLVITKNLPDGYWMTEPTTSNNLTPNKNEHTTYKGETIEIRTVDRSISTGTTSRGQSVQSGVSPSRFGSVDKRYQA